MSKPTTQMQVTAREEDQLPEIVGFGRAPVREQEPKLAMNSGEKVLESPRQARDKPSEIMLAGTDEVTPSGVRGLIKEIGKLPPYHATLFAIAAVAFAVAVVMIKG